VTTAATVVLACGSLLGEGPVWDERTGTLVFIDIKDPAVWRFRPATGEYDRRALAERIGFAALTGDPDILVLGLKSGLSLHRWGDGATRVLVKPEPELPGNRINDGTVDFDGSIIFGTMDDAEEMPTGRLYRWHPEDGLSVFDEGYVVSNGPVAHPDGQRFFAIDSVARAIKVFDRLGKGFGKPTVFFQFPEAWGYPDGMVADAAGNLWVAHWDGSAVTCLSSNGEVIRSHAVPAPNVTKPCFGGPDLATMFLTTAHIGTDRSAHPDAGHLFAFVPGAVGLAPVFATANLDGAFA
jgi:sugar lactone lactonase YvrE